MGPPLRHLHYFYYGKTKRWNWNIDWSSVTTIGYMADTHPQTSKIINFYDPFLCSLLPLPSPPPPHSTFRDKKKRQKINKYINKGKHRLEIPKHPIIPGFLKIASGSHLKLDFMLEGLKFRVSSRWISTRVKPRCGTQAIFGGVSAYV